MKRYYLPSYLLLLFFLYFPSISAGRFVLDDSEHLDAPHIQSGISINNIRTMLTWGKHVDFLPVHNFSHMVEASILPGSEALSHFNNILIFLLIVIALYYAFQNFFLLPSLPAFLATVAVTINGTSHEMVVWINGRKDSLSLLFILIFILYTNSFLKKNSGFNNFNSRSFFKICMTWLLYSLALFSKQNAVVVLPMLITCYLWESRGKYGQISKSAALFIAGSLLLSVGYSVMFSTFYSTVNVMTWHVDTLTRVQLHWVALGHHLFDWLLPFFQILHPRQTGLWLNLNYNFVYLGIFVWLVVLGILMNIHRIPKEMTRSFFWIIFFYAPVSGLLFEHIYFYSARYAYPSLIGFVGLFFQLIEHYKKKNMTQNINYALIILLFLYSGIHLHHNFRSVHRWQESSLVWKHSHLKQPEDPALAAFYLRSIFIDSMNKTPIAEKLEPDKKDLISFLEKTCSREESLNKALYSCAHFRETMFAASPDEKNAYYLLDKKFDPWLQCKGLLRLKRYEKIDALLKKYPIDISTMRENNGMRDCRYIYLCLAKGMKAAEEYKNKLIQANMARRSVLKYWGQISRSCNKD